MRWNWKNRVTFAVVVALVSASAVVAQSVIPQRPINNTSAIATLWADYYTFKATAQAYVPTTPIRTPTQTGQAPTVTSTPQPSATSTLAPTATRTPTVAATQTPQPTSTSAPTPAPTLVPTETPTHTHGAQFDCAVPAAQRSYVCAGELADALAVIPNLIGQVCPQWVHDQYTVVATQLATGEWVTTPGRGAVSWRTWHPQVDPQTGCHFAHEHGADPTTSQADSSLPAFGLIGCLHGSTHCTEPHEGHKIFIAHVGDVEEDGHSVVHARVVFHFGTSRPGRATNPIHSFEYDVVSANGEFYVHTMGMAFSNLAGSICDRNRSIEQNSDPSDDVGRTLSESPGTNTAACPNNDVYEIWNSSFSILHPDARPDFYNLAIRVSTSVAAFDAATMFNRNGVTDGTGCSGAFCFERTGLLGCDRETYFESPWYWEKSPEITSSYTDMEGNVLPQGAPGGALQKWSPYPDALGYENTMVVMGTSPTKGDSNLVKLHRSQCAAGLAFPN